MMDYRKEFDPNQVERFVLKTDDPSQKGDTRTQSVYVYDDRIVLAINVALAHRATAAYSRSQRLR